MRPICVPCQRFYFPKKNGVAFTEGMQAISGARPGKNPKGWKPYKLWMGDLWACPSCGTETIVGTGRDCIAEHYQEDFQSKLDSFKPEVQVNG